MRLTRKQLRKVLLNEIFGMFKGDEPPATNPDAHLGLDMSLDDAIELEASYLDIGIFPGQTYGEIIDIIEGSSFQLTPDMDIAGGSPRISKIKDMIEAYGLRDDVFGDGQATHDRFVR